LWGAFKLFYLFSAHDSSNAPPDFNGLHSVCKPKRG
jgi:hypothetical protein